MCVCVYICHTCCVYLFVCRKTIHCKSYNVYCIFAYTLTSCNCIAALCTSLVNHLWTNLTHCICCCSYRVEALWAPNSCWIFDMKQLKAGHLSLYKAYLVEAWCSPSMRFTCHKSATSAASFSSLSILGCNKFYCNKDKTNIGCVFINQQRSHKVMTVSWRVLHLTWWSPWATCSHTPTLQFCTLAAELYNMGHCVVWVWAAHV